MSSSNFNSQSSSGSQDNTSQMLNDIQSLQDIEQQLFSSLEENQNLTQSQQQQIIQKINDISNMRINLYKTLNSMNSNFQSNLQSSQGTLNEQTSAISIVENELNQAKEKLRVLEEEKNNKIRLIEINNYFGEKYAEHSALMKIIVAILFPILILAILNRKGIIPNTVSLILICIVAGIGSYFFWKRLISIWYRDSMNYQEYTWSFDPSSAPVSTDASNVSDPWTRASSNTGTCIGDACCSSGLTWDSSLNQCTVSSSNSTSSVASSAAPVSSGSSGSNSHGSSGSNSHGSSGSNSHGSSGSNDSHHTESFINHVLTKHAYQFKKPDVVLGSENVQPVYSSSFINFGKF
jgi:uncharacterized membrane protein YgcG